MADLAVHVTPRGGRDEVVGWRGTELSVRVAVAPEGGKANAAACVLIAEVLGVPKSSVRVVRGHTARHKLLHIEGVGDSAVRTAFGEPDQALF
jgi:uncharacterized protein YggU (UPF0235/DUF167 family)